MGVADYVLKPQARFDVLDIFIYIAKDNLKVADQFLDALHTTSKYLTKMPHMGVEYFYTNPALHNVRMFPVKKFSKYLVFYRPVKKGIEVIRVIHGARDLPILFN